MSTTQTETLQYQEISETSENLEWADLATLDLSKFDKPGGKQELASELIKAIDEVGFFYVTNHGLSQRDVDTQFAIGKEVLNLDLDQKAPYRAALEAGDYNGWKPAGTRDLIPGVKDNFEIYNIPKFTTEHAARPQSEIVRQHWSTIERFSRHIHDRIVKKLLAVFSLALELDEQWFNDRHRYEERSGDHLRYMKYYRRTEEENSKLGNVWLKGHSDMGSLTLLFRQPVAALQVLSKDGSWKWVRPQTDAITVNIADALHFMTNGFLKSSIHRVVAPPKDQAHVDRLGVLYMVRIEDKTPLAPIKESPLLQRLGLTEKSIADSGGNPINAGEWVRQRVMKNLGATSTAEGDNEVNDVEILKGVRIKYYD